MHTVQSGILFHCVDLGLGASQKGIPLSQLEQLGRVCRIYFFGSTQGLRLLQRVRVSSRDRLMNIADTLVGRIRDANPLRLYTTRLQVLGPIPVPATFAQRRSQNRNMERSNSLLCMGSDCYHPDRGAVQPGAILF